MKMALLTNIVSPHQLPLARALAERLGNDNFRYIATEGEHIDRTKLGWLIGDLPPWVIHPGKSVAEEAEAWRWSEEATILLSGLREFDLFRQRAERGLQNYYMSERWFKPPIGFLRMLHPRYLRMARKLNVLHRKGVVVYLPMGTHAAEDMARISGFFKGGLPCLFQKHRLTMKAKQPLESFAYDGSSPFKDKAVHELKNMRLWGYFVEPSERFAAEPKDANADREALLRVLWVGRMLNWKRLDTLVSAVVRLLNEGIAIRCKVVGYGPEEKKLRRLAGRFLVDGANNSKDSTELGSKADGCGNSATPGIVFGKPVPIAQVRSLMREADVVVLSSDGGEGWGSVVNEAMAEGRCVIGTNEAGSSATMIDHGVNGWLYHAGNVTELADLLRQLDKATIRECGKRARETMEKHWSPESAAERLLRFASQESMLPFAEA